MKNHDLSKQLLNIILIINTLFIIACKNKDLPENETLVVAKSQYTIGSTGGNIEIEVISNTQWEVISPESEWITLPEITRGVHNGIIRVFISKNTKMEDRTAILMIESDNIERSVDIIQEPYKMELKSPSLLFTSEELSTLKEAINKANSGSLKSAYTNLILRNNSALNHTSVVYKGIDSYIFLQNIATSASFARDLALGYHLTGNVDYSKKSLEIINDWAVGCTGITYDVAASTSMYLARSLFPMICAYDMMKESDQITATIRNNIEAWFQSLFPQIKAGINYWEQKNYFEKQEYQNHLVAHMMGVLALGVVLEDVDAVKFALDSPDNPRDFQNLIAGCIFMDGDIPHHREDANAPPPEKGEIYDRYRHKTGPTRGLQYSHLTLSLLTTSARICHNNGLDMFSYTAPTGENIGLSFQYYSDFYRLMDSCIKSGFYCGETERIGKAGDDHGLFEIGMRYYPDIQEINDLVYSGSYNRSTNYSTLHGFYRFFSVPIDPVH